MDDLYTGYKRAVDTLKRVEVKAEQGTLGSNGANITVKLKPKADDVSGGASQLKESSDIAGHIEVQPLSRTTPGTASFGGNLKTIQVGDKWLKGTSGNAGKVPAQIAEKLNGKQFKSFDEFRETFWKEVANDPVLSKQFNKANLAKMKNGKAPHALPDQQVGNRQTYELDHNQEIQDGGNVYDMNNIVIRTPLNHIEKTKTMVKVRK